MLLLDLHWLLGQYWLWAQMWCRSLGGVKIAVCPCVIAIGQIVQMSPRETKIYDCYTIPGFLIGQIRIRNSLREFQIISV